MAAGSTLVMHAVGYDQQGNYLEVVESIWGTQSTVNPLFTGFYEPPLGDTTTTLTFNATGNGEGHFTAASDIGPAHGETYVQIAHLSIDSLYMVDVSSQDTVQVWAGIESVNVGCKLTNQSDTTLTLTNVDLIFSDLEWHFIYEPYSG